MIKLIFFFLVLLGAVFIGLHIHADPGYLYLSLYSWSVEMPVWLAVVLLAFVFLVFNGVLLICEHILKWPKIWREWRKQHHIHKSIQNTQLGFIELNEGRWQSAQKIFIKALPHAQTPLINYLMAARAAQELNQYNLRDRYLSDAERDIPQAKIAITLTKTKWLLDDHQWEQALATLKYLQTHTSKHPLVLMLMLQLYQETEDWNQLITLLPDIQRSHILSENKFLNIQHKAYTQVLNQLISLNLIQETENYIHKLPRELKSDTPIMLSYAIFLLDNNKIDQAEKILHSITSQTPEVLFCMGQLCLKQKLWGKAKQYFEESLRLHPSAKTYLALGNLLIQLNDPENARIAFQTGLLLALK